MVHLQAVRLRGFKTFAKPTELLLEPGVTVIIGPNGSGKSNLADAVLWVLGEQSPSNLRGRTMQDIMFSGADGKRSSAVAEVTLVFDSGSGSLPLDCAELEVTRRLTRETGSEYRLNGSDCRLLDIQDVMGALGLGREMHSVVGQGKVESLLNSSPEYRRAMVEEAAGLGRYKKRRERARAKLERTSQNLVRAQDIEEEVRATMRPLRQQVAAAERFAEATEEWAGAHARLVLHSLVEVRESYKQAEAELQGIEGGLAEVGARVGELRQQRTAEDEGHSSALKERERLGALYHQMRARAEHLQGRSTALRQRLARAEADLDRARRRHELAKSAAVSLAARLEEVRSRTADETRLSRVEGWSKALRSELEEALPAYQAKARDEDDLKDSVFELEAARSRAVQDREFLRREKDERSRVSAELSGLVGQSMARVEQLRAEAASLATSAVEAEESVKQAEAEVQSAETEREAARGRAAEAANSEVALAETVAGLQSRQEVLRGILERKEGVPRGARQLLAGPGGYRLLSELLTVEPGYERAVAAALGPIVHAVVVSGSRTPEALLREAAGPLDVVKEDGAGGESSSPIRSQRARDLWELVSGPEGVIRALRALVPATEVLEELGDLGRGDKTATRFVSRAGELVQAGVYAARREELAVESLLATRNELDTVTREREALSKQWADAAKTVEEAAAEAGRTEQRLRQLEERLREKEHRLAEKRSEVELCKRRLEESTTQVEELRGRDDREKRATEEVAEQLLLVEEGIAAKEAELEDARASLRGLQTGLESMRRKVAMLEAKRGQAALVEVRLRERCRTISSERARIEGQREAAAREVKRCECRVEFGEKHGPVVAELLAVAELVAARGQIVADGLESQVAAARTQTEGTARVVRDWSSAEIGLQREYDSMTARLTQVRVDQTRLEDRRNQLEEELAELRRRHVSPRNLTAADVAGAEQHSLASAVERADRRRERIGPVNPLAEQEYAQMEERARFLAEQRADLEAAVAQLREVIVGLDKHIEEAFNEIFEAAKENFAAVISVVFPGAKGTLSLTEARAGLRAVSEPDEETGPEDQGAEPVDAAAGGVMLEVKFANKAPRSLSLLSGGEKAMTAIAFLFSLFLARPCPFYILDEVEASLDDLNIRRFLSLVHKYRGKTQFIIITHQRQTMEVADTLYGVALESDGTSRILSRRMKMAKGA
jgi:chromosome segregation protein